jgi:microcystin-dependent protein
MTTPYIGQISLLSFNYPPRGWALCNGQLLSTTQHQALFSLLGTTFGGDGRTTFALPNLQGMVPLHFGQGPGGNAYSIGDLGGKAGYALGTSEIAQHTHTMRAKAALATADSSGTNPSPSVALAQPVASQSSGTVPVNIYSRNPKNAVMGNNAIAMEGGGQPHENRQPFLVISFCIATDGIYPSPD